MARVHTAHGVGEIIQTETVRGRTSHLVEGAGFRAWVPATQCRTAEVNEDNSTTLPYDPTPQYPSDMWANQATILPGDQEIDAEERTSPSDSLDFDSRSGHAWPAPDPSLFAKEDKHGKGRLGATDEWLREENERKDRQILDSASAEDSDFYRWMVENNPRAARYHDLSSLKDFYGEEYRNRHSKREIRANLSDKYASGMLSVGRDTGDDISVGRWDTAPASDSGPYWDEEYGTNVEDLFAEEPDADLDREDARLLRLRENLGWWREGPKGADKKEANLGPKYATWVLSAGRDSGDDSVSRFRRDPVAEIQRMGQLVHGNNTDPHVEEYGRLIEADRMLREAAWKDVRAKAQRLRREGRVHVKDLSHDRIYATVEGDHGTYDVMVHTGSDMGNFGSGQTVKNLYCGCDWGAWQFKRMTYVGRMCSHQYATYMEKKSQQGKKKRPPYRPGEAPMKYRRVSSVTSDFQKYVDDYRGGHIDQDAADNFIDLPDQDLTDADVSTLYDYVENNHTERADRPFGDPPAFPDGPLRTEPASLTPDLFRVPPPDDSYLVDVEKDERATTAPDGIVSDKDWKTAARYVDALGNPYAPSSFWRTADETTGELVEDEEKKNGGTTPTPGATSTSAGQTSTSAGQDSSTTPDSATETAEAAPDTTQQTAQEAAPEPPTEAATPKQEEDPRFRGSFDPSMIGGIVGPIAQGIGTMADSFTGSGLASGLASGATSMISGLGSGLGGFFTASTDDGVYGQFPVSEVDRLRALSADDPALGHMDVHNDEIREVIDELREDGADASQIVAAYNDVPWDDEDDDLERDLGFDDDEEPKKSRFLDFLQRRSSYGVGNQGTNAPGGAFLQPGGGSWADKPSNGSGPDPKAWGTTSQEAIDLFDHDGSHTDQDVTDLGEDYITQHNSNHPPQKVSWRDGDPDDPRTEAGLPPRNKKEMDRNLAENLGGPDPENSRRQSRNPKAAAAGDHSDIVRRFHASGAAETINGPTRSDDDIVGRARSFLAKTAGRVYSQAEQQALIDEPGTARNKPTRDDLRGTHYVDSL